MFVVLYLVFACFSLLAKRLAEKSVSDVTYFVSNGTLSVNGS